MARWYRDTILINTHGKGLYDISRAVETCLNRWVIQDGVCYLYVQHTSASLIISEQFDSTAREDMEEFMERLIPENQSWYTHTAEGPDDSSSHLRAMITPTSQTIPIDNGKLSLGMWQGLYLFEHRQVPHRRQVLIRCLSIDENEKAN